MTDTQPRVTLNDVAAASGVSRATASFVLRDSPGQSISAATRERVRAGGARPRLRAARRSPARCARAPRASSCSPSTRPSTATTRAATSAASTRSSRRTTTCCSSGTAPRTRAVAGSELLDAIAPRAVLRFGEPYLTGHELDDSGGGWRDGLAAHVAAQIGYLAERGHTADRARAARPRDPAARGPAAVRRPGRGQRSACRRWSRSPCPRRHGCNRDTERRRLTPWPPCRAAHPAVTAVAAFDDDVALRVLAAMRDARPVRARRPRRHRLRRQRLRRAVHARRSPRCTSTRRHTAARRPAPSSASTPADRRPPPAGSSSASPPD